MVDRNDYLTLKEAAELIGSTEAAIRSAVQRGLIRYTRAWEGKLMVNKQSVLEYRLLYQKSLRGLYPEG